MSLIGPVVSEEKMFENVTDDGRTDAGRRSHWYTISSPMSLRLRRAKNRNLLLNHCPNSM